MDDDADSVSGRAELPKLYRLDSNQSSSSVFEDVEMAHDEVFFSAPLAPQAALGDYANILPSAN